MSATGAIVLLSSSPPRIFARSPTPAENIHSSPALPSPGAIFALQRSNGGSDDPITRKAGCDRGWRTTERPWGGSNGAFPSKKEDLLREKRGWENVPITKSRTEDIPVETQKENDRSEPNRCIGTPATEGHSQDLSCRAPNDQTQATEASRSPERSPVCLDKACSRRLDWTPPKAGADLVAADEPGAVSFNGESLGSFSYTTAAHAPEATTDHHVGGGGIPIKRRKLDVLETAAAPKLAARKTRPKKASSKDRKSPKKYTTITGLATAQYQGVESETSPILQYLSATQQALQSDANPAPDTAKRKKAGKKIKDSNRKGARKSVLLSPGSAIRCFENQDVLFGSASQLAREESPTLIRDTVQAMKRSEQNASFNYDQISTQTTLPTSEPADSPRRDGRRGVSRFVKTRNLWSMADRDHDHALLQVDTVDMFDSPGVRAAFAGKDALIEPGVARVRESESPNKQLAGGKHGTEALVDNRGESIIEPQRGPRLQPGANRTVFDVDELGLQSPRATISSAARSQTRGLHTAATRSCNAAPSAVPDATSTTPASAPTAAPAPVQIPARPAFKGFTTTQLASQLVAYGFKPIKKRDKMIEILDRCWDDKLKVKGVPQSGAAADSNADGNKDSAADERSHDDFLTKVHDVSARPTPKVEKVKKARTRRKKSEGETDKVSVGAAKPAVRKSSSINPTGEGDEPPPTKTKTKAKKPTGSGTKPRRTATSKSKMPLSVEHASDIDASRPDALAQAERGNPAAILPLDHLTDLHDPGHGKSRGSDERLDSIPISAPADKSTTTAITTGTSEQATPQKQSTHPKTPSSSNPPLSSSSSEEEEEETKHTQIHHAITNTTTTTTTSTAKSNTKSYHPTWHEKILMYDPIPLEDLTAWLADVAGLSVKPDDVAVWCERVGVCYWRSRREGRVKGKVKGGVKKGRVKKGGLGSTDLES